jgi:hypothetical protein
LLCTWAAAHPGAGDDHRIRQTAPCQSTVVSIFAGKRQVDPARVGRELPVQ